VAYTLAAPLLPCEDGSKGVMVSCRFHHSFVLYGSSASCILCAYAAHPSEASADDLLQWPCSSFSFSLCFGCLSPRLRHSSDPQLAAKIPSQTPTQSSLTFRGTRTPKRRQFRTPHHLGRLVTGIASQSKTLHPSIPASPAITHRLPTTTLCPDASHH
jgi:hypothetical protein